MAKWLTTTKEETITQIILLVHFTAIFLLITLSQPSIHTKLKNSVLSQALWLSIKSFFIVTSTTALYLFFAGVYFLVSWDNPLLSMTSEQADQAAKSLKNPKALIMVALFSIWPILLITYSFGVLLFSKIIIREYRVLN